MESHTFRRIQKEANSTHGNKTPFHFAKEQFIAQQFIFARTQIKFPPQIQSKRKQERRA